MKKINIGKRGWTRFNIFWVLAFVLAFQSGGCTVISVEGPLLTEDNSDRLTGLEGIYEVVELPKEPDSKDNYTPVLIESVSSFQSNAENTKYILSLPSSNEFAVLRFKQIKEGWFIAQAKVAEKEKLDLKQYFSLYLVAWENDKYIFYLHKSGRGDLDRLFKTNPIVSQPPLAGHVEKNSSSIIIDQIAAKEYKEELFQFFSSLTINELEPINELNPIEEKVAWARWCGLAAASPEDPENKNGKSVRWDKIEPLPAMTSCRGAIDLNPGSPRMHFQYGRALHKAKRYPEAQAWYRKAADQGYAAGHNGLGQLYFDGLGVDKNHETAIAWHKKAAKLGHTGSQKIIDSLENLP